MQITRYPQRMVRGHRLACPYPAARFSLQCSAKCALPMPPSAPQTLPGCLLLGICPHVLLLPSLCAAKWRFHQDNRDAPRSLSPIHGATASLLGTIATRQLMNYSKWHLFTKTQRRKPSSIPGLLSQGHQPCISQSLSNYQLHQGIREEEGASLWAGESFGRHVKWTSSPRR